MQIKKKKKVEGNPTLIARIQHIALHTNAKSMIERSIHYYREQKTRIQETSRLILERPHG